MKPAIAATKHKLQVSEMRSGLYRLIGKLAKPFARREGAGGQGLVEFAFILPLVLLLISGIVEFGRMLSIYNSVSNAAREAARYGTVVGDPGNGANYYYLDCNGMRAAAKRTSAFAVLNDSDITIVYDHGSGASFGTCAQGVQPSPGIANGDRVFVTATTNYSPILPLLPISSRAYTVSAARSIFPNIAGSPQCGDNADNDGDGQIDYPADPGCSSSADTDETDAGAAGCYTLTTSVIPGAGGSVSVSPTTAGCYTAGISVVITASPNTGADYGFQNWTDASGTSLGTSNPVTVVMDGNKTYNANFALGCYTLTITQPANGTITPSAQNCAGGYTLNTIVTVSVNGASGYALDYWTGALGGSENPTTLIMSGSKSLSAVMKSVPCYTLTTGVESGSGTISAPSPAANCSGGLYNQFTTVTLTATASAGTGNDFDHWTIKDTDTGVTLATSTFNPVDVSIDQNTTVTAAFIIVPCMSLTVSAGSGGTVSVSPSSPVNCPANQYFFGNDVTLTASPATGYSFTGWSGNASGTTNPLIVTMDADKIISAAFTANCYTLTKTVAPDTTSSPPVPSASGSVSVSIVGTPPNGTCAGANQYTYNTQLQLQAVPAANYSFSSWSGAVTGNSNPTPLTMWASNASVTARFNGNCVLASALSITPPGASSKKIQLNYTNYTGALRTLNTLVVTWPTGPGKKFWKVYFGTSSDLIADPKDQNSPSIITTSDWSSLNRGMIDASAKTLILEFTFDISGSFSVRATFDDDDCTGTTVSATFP